MLARLSIRDIVLIERLDIEFARGLAVLTGETGAGKSILLDAFALALGGRGDAGLVRHGVEHGQVTASFDVAKGHPAFALLAANGLDDRRSGEMILRRVQLADGRTRAFINDQTRQRADPESASAPRWSRSTASTTSARWSMPPPIAGCSTPLPASTRTSSRWKRCGRRAAPPAPRSTSTAPGWSAPRARPTICATPPTN